MFKSYDVTGWEANNCNTHMDQYLEKKGNEAIKFGQVIEYNTRKFFLEKPYTNCDGETISRPFSEKLKLSISLDQWSKVLYSLFLLYTKSRTIEIHWYF